MILSRNGIFDDKEYKDMIPGSEQEMVSGYYKESSCALIG